MRGPPSPSALCKPKSLSTGKLLAAKRSFGGIVGELEQFPHNRAMQSAPTTSSTQGNGSLTDQRAEHPADANGSCQFAPYYFPPRSLSGALFRRPNSQRGKRECRAKLKILFVGSSLASPGDRLSGLWARIFSAKQRRAIQNKAMSEEGKPRSPRPAGLPSDRVIVSSLGPTARPCLTVCERNTCPRNARDQIPFRGLSLKFGT